MGPMRRSAFLIATGVVWACSSFGATPGTGGSPFRTESAAVEVHLDNGAGLRLSPRSFGTLYADRVVLEEGGLRIADFGGYTVDARQLQIQAADPAARAVVRMTGKTIEVASLGGSLKVTDGAALTRVVAGTRVSFQRKGPARNKPLPDPDRMPRGEKIVLWVIGVSAVAALVIGVTAAAQGKSL